MTAQRTSALTPSLLTSLSLLNAFMQKQSFAYCIIGGLAVQVRGEPRLTQDIDITIQVDIADEDKVLDAFLAEFPPRIADARSFAKQNKVLLLEIQSIPLDIAIGLTGFEHETVKRASLSPLSKELTVPICSAEDLIVHKCVAGREKDFLDIAGVLIRSKGKLDLNYIQTKLKEFSDILETDDFVHRFELILNKKKQS